MISRSALFVALLPLLFSGCSAVGPDYTGAPPTPEQPSFARAEGIGHGTPLDAWWKALGDKHLDSLVERALNANPTVAVAQARLRRARASLQLERQNQAPKGSASALYAHARLPGTSTSEQSSSQTNAPASSASANSSSDTSSGSNEGGSASSLNLYSVGFDATWEIDIFGGQRRAVEAARASAAAAEANLADAQVSLTSEVVQAYVNLRDCQQRLTLNAGAIRRQERMLALTEQRMRAGTASRVDFVRLQGQLESTRADALPLDAQRDAHLNEIASLLGEAAGALDSELAEVAPVPLPPALVNAGDPAALLRRRPDIRAAERTLASRTAQIGKAEAGKFPKLTILGLIGLGGTSLSDLSHLDNYTAIIAPQLSWSFLDFGRAQSKIEEAQADRDEAQAQYQSAVNSALRDAEDALSRYRNRRAVVATIARSKMASDEAATLVRQRNVAGTASLIDLLDSERQQISAEKNLSQALAGMTTDFVSLQKALGLGWMSL